MSHPLKNFLFLKELWHNLWGKIQLSLMFLAMATVSVLVLLTGLYLKLLCAFLLVVWFPLVLSGTPPCFVLIFLLSHCCILCSFWVYFYPHFNEIHSFPHHSVSSDGPSFCQLTVASTCYWLSNHSSHFRTDFRNYLFEFWHIPRFVRKAALVSNFNPVVLLYLYYIGKSNFSFLL